MPVTLRIARESDAPALVEIYAPYVRHTAITFEYDVPSSDEFARRIRTTLERFPYLVAEQNGEMIGYAYAGPLKERAAYAWAVETSIYVRSDRKRSGVGRVLYDALEDILRLQGVTNLNACIATPQIEDETLTYDSVSFHERLGYRLIGEFRQCGYKFNRWYNMVWMEKLIAPHLAHQTPVTPFPTLLPQVQALLARDYAPALTSADPVWYHGSPHEIDILHAGSTITPWRDLAQAFSHKPAMLCIADDLRITHDGEAHGYLYRIAEPIEPETDYIAHPRSSMNDEDAVYEYVTRRPLRLKKIADTGVPSARDVERARAELDRFRDSQL